jgi:riboflavin biosynthesis pyrimidine reductase
VTAQWRTRFERLVAAKTHQAMSAQLFPYRTEFVDPVDRAAAIASPWSAAMFDGPFYVLPSRDPERPACSLVFVQSADGNTVADDPAELGGGETDKHLVYEGLSRVCADAVMAGAGTVREGDIVFSVWHPDLVRLRAELGRARHPVQMVATLRGFAIERMLLCNVPEIPVILLTVGAVARQMEPATRVRPWITVLPMDGPDDLPRVFRQLGERGLARVSCVGGRTLASQLLERGLVDDVYLTTGTRTGGAPETPVSRAPWRGRLLARKQGTGAEEGVIVEHLLARPR